MKVYEKIFVEIKSDFKNIIYVSIRKNRNLSL